MGHNDESRSIESDSTHTVIHKEVILFSKCQFLDEEIDVHVDFKSMQVVCVSLQPHQEATIRHIGRSAARKHTLMYAHTHTHTQENVCVLQSVVCTIQ